MNEKSVLGVAVVGLGVGEAHARGYEASGMAQLRAVYDLESDKSRRFVASRPHCHVAASFEEILVSPEIDLVSIASYDDYHAEQVVMALEAEKHVFVEKPLCRTRTELDRIRRIWEEHPHLALASNLVLRAAPLYRRLKAEIESGRFGEIYAIDGDYLYGRIEKITAGWRGKVADYSVMMGGGVHLVDLMMWLTGRRPCFVYARGNGLVTRDSDYSGNDYVAATYTFPSGMIGRITANFGCVHPHQHGVRVFGEKATLLHDDRGSRLHRGRDRSPDVIMLDQPSLPSSKAALIPDFLEAIMGRRDHRKDVYHEFAVMAACMAADESIEKKEEVEVLYL